MSKLEQSMGETFGAILGLHRRLCPCIEMARNRDAPIKPLSYFSMDSLTRTAYRDWRRLNHQRI